MWTMTVLAKSLSRSGSEDVDLRHEGDEKLPNAMEVQFRHLLIELLRQEPEHPHCQRQHC